MAIFRGIGGAGDSTTDATVTAVTEQAVNAATSATQAASSASSAASSASAAATSATNAENAYDSFDDRYLGVKASDPALDNDGAALLTGALYFNSTDNEMRVYTGSVWIAVVDLAGDVTVTSLTASSVDINGGTIDGVTIGGASAGAGTFTTLGATGDVSIADKIVHTGDTNTAIRFPSADTVTVETAGTERMRITSAGSVNIGGTSGQAKFEVNLAVSTTGSLTDTTIHLATTAVTGRKVNIGFGLPGGVGNTNAATIGFDVTNGAGALQGDLFFATRGSTADSVPTERMRITSSGNVGIGTTTPAQKLHVNGAIRAASGDVNVYGGNSGSNANRVALCMEGSGAGRILVNGSGVGSNGSFKIDLADSAGTVAYALTYDSSGNLGLGNTPSPTSASGYMAFELGANAGTGLTGNNGDLYLTENAYVNGGAWRYAASSVVSAMYNLGSGVHRWYTAPSGTAGNAITFTQAMTLDASGRLGIGTTSPSTGVEIAGAFFGAGGLAITQNNGNGNGGRGPSVDFKISQSEDGSVLVTGGRIATLKDDGSDASGAASLVFYTSDSTPTLTERMRITSSGNVGIGTTSPASALDVTGTVNATTVNTTNIEVTNIKAKDGTASATIADSTGVMTIASSVLTTTDINGGTIDGVTIGGASAGAITGTTITGTQFSSDATDVELKYSGSTKLSTTNTGIDVTGTVTADGLTIEGSAGPLINLYRSDVNALFGAIQFKDTTNTNENARIGWAANELRLQGTNQVSLITDEKTRLFLASTGDISFYEDTGTTAKLVWDASTEELKFKDNVKAYFGDGGDLQIYHQGTNSFISDASGTGFINIRSNAVRLASADGLEILGDFVQNGAVTLYYNNSAKFATTSTGIDVTGTVTADGLTVDGGGTFQGSSTQIDLIETDIADNNTRLRQTVGDFFIQTVSDDKATIVGRLNLDHATGDISFYEDTGTSQNFYWDASTSRLGLGTTSPATTLDVEGTVRAETGSDYTDLTNFGVEFNRSTSYLRPNTDGTKVLLIGADNVSKNWSRIEHGASDRHVFNIGASEAMRIDSSGNLLVGTTVEFGNSGITLNNAGLLYVDRDGNKAAVFSRRTSDGAIVEFSKDFSTVGSIGTVFGDLCIGTGDTGIRFWDAGPGIFPVDPSNTFANKDNAIDLGLSSVRWRDLYLSEGVRADTLKFSSLAGSEYGRFDSSGRLLIGRTTGTSLLYVNGTGADIAINDNGGTYNYRQTTLKVTGDRFLLQTRNGDGAFVSQDYIVDKGISGATSHQWLIDGLERMRIDSSGNLLVGGTGTPTSSVGNFVLYNGTAPTGNATNGVILYAEDVSASSELKVRDEAGNVTTLSPHNFDLIPEGPSEDMAWSYYSERDGKRINVDMLKAIRLLEQLTGEKLVHTS